MVATTIQACFVVICLAVTILFFRYIVPMVIKELFKKDDNENE